MFENLLRDRDLDDVVESTYLVSQIIWHRKNAPAKEMLEARARLERSTTAQIELAEHLIEAIEAKEKRSLKDLDDARGSEYVKLLSKIAQDWAQSNRTMDKKTGSKLLKELRAFAPAYPQLASRLRALGCRVVKSATGSPRVEVWFNPRTNGSVQIQDRGIPISSSSIAKICEKLGITPNDIDNVEPD